MTTLVWDDIGTHVYEAGVDRGVLYLTNGIGVAWNGLTSITEKMSNDDEPIYFDGVKYANHIALGEFSASLKAYTYPDEFLEFEGILYSNNGLYIGNQPSKRFGLSYRTKIGNDTEGIDAGYKLHVLYNLTAIPSDRDYTTLSAAPEAIEFQWDISAIPEDVPGFRPTAHLILDSRLMSPALLSDIEDTLYGDGITDATLPPISTLVSFIGQWVIMRITDNLDGTWTADDGDGGFITMLSGTEFQIVQANAVYLNATTYNISDVTY
jgi:hypothetical protein